MKSWKTRTITIKITITIIIKITIITKITKITRITRTITINSSKILTIKRGSKNSIKLNLLPLLD